MNISNLKRNLKQADSFDQWIGAQNFIFTEDMKNNNIPKEIQSLINYRLLKLCSVKKYLPKETYRQELKSNLNFLQILKKNGYKRINIFTNINKNYLKTQLPQEAIKISPKVQLSGNTTIIDTYLHDIEERARILSYNIFHKQSKHL